jgi:hypothetical protein
MRITSTRTLLFKVKGQQDFILRPSPRPTFAPDFIRDTNLFQLALKDGTIEDFTPHVALVDDAKAAADGADAEAKAKADTDKAAADAKAKADAEAKDKKAK